MKQIFLIILPVFLLLSCKQEIKSNINISGAAQGTTYQITYLAGANANYREEIDSIFKQIDLSLSTYNPSSLISRMNRNDSTVVADELFLEVFRKAVEVSDATNGVFDMTVAPIVNAYGFGFTKKEKVTAALIDSLLPLVGYNMVRMVDGKLVKDLPQIMLDFNALAQGYTVDLLSAFLEQKGIKNYLVEVGGELKAKGRRLDESNWTVGIEQPNEDISEGASLRVTFKVKDRALATSGNYKKFYVEDGKKYAHIINPMTGYPAKHHLLSATVVANDCMTADAYATAFMVMGMDEAKKFLAAHKDLNLEVLFIYDENGKSNIFMSEKFTENIELMQ